MVKPKLSQARKVAVATIEAAADNHATNVLPIIREIKRPGATTLRKIADVLNRAFRVRDIAKYAIISNGQMGLPPASARCIVGSVVICV